MLSHSVFPARPCFSASFCSFPYVLKYSCPLPPAGIPAAADTYPQRSRAPPCRGSAEPQLPGLHVSGLFSCQIAATSGSLRACLSITLTRYGGTRRAACCRIRRLLFVRVSLLHSAHSLYVLKYFCLLPPAGIPAAADTPSQSSRVPPRRGSAEPQLRTFRPLMYPGYFPVKLR